MITPLYQQLTPLGRVGKIQFLPSQIANLNLWLKADVGLWKDTGGTTAATADGDLVARWDDQSGNGNNVTQATSGNRPALKLAIQNSRNIVRFTGSSPTYLTCSLASSQPYTVYLVARTTNNTTNQYFLDGAAENSGAVIAPGSLNSGHLRMYAGTVLDASGTQSNWNVLAAVFNGSSSVLSIDAVDTTGSAGTGNTTGVTVGTSGTTHTDAPLTGDIAELLIYGGAHSSGQRTQVENYLNGRWAIY